MLDRTALSSLEPTRGCGVRMLSRRDRPRRRHLSTTRNKLPGEEARTAASARRRAGRQQLRALIASLPTYGSAASTPICTARHCRSGAQRPIPSGLRRHEAAWTPATAQKRQS
jgi:hypothetical protein